VVVPNVIGLTVFEAVSTLHEAYITDSFGTTTCITGTNHVVAQFPVAGTSVPQGSTISLSCA
jgi:beta-lactam-binding protein with PASTA domain